MSETYEIKIGLTDPLIDHADTLCLLRRGDSARVQTHESGEAFATVERRKGSFRVRMPGGKTFSVLACDDDLSSDTEWSILERIEAEFIDLRDKIERKGIS